MNSYLESFIHDARLLAMQRNVPWELQLNPEGIAIASDRWNLTQMVGASPPPTDWLSDFGTDRKTIEMFNSSPPSGPLRQYKKRPLSRCWQDLIKACAIDQLFVRRNTCSHIVCNVVRPLRVLATCVPDKEPWEVTSNDVLVAIDIARKMQASGKLADLIFGVAKSVLDSNHLTDSGPITPALTRDTKIHQRTSKFAKSKAELRSALEERKHEEKLPERRAFWELTRIAFTEIPRTFLDQLRFAQAKTLILTGLRDGECALLPSDWKRYRNALGTEHQRTNPTVGISRSLMLRHFAEKQRAVYEDSNSLFETVQHVPLMFEEALTQTLDQVLALTEPLRATLRQQVETDRILPKFMQDELVRVLELYTFLTGNPFMVASSENDRAWWVSRYQSDYDPRVFDDLRASQLRAVINGATLTPAIYQYLRRFNGVTLRKENGTTWTDSGKKSWSDVYVRIDELEKFLASEKNTKQSDATPVKLANGELAAWELLFLMPKRALSDTVDNGLCDITRYCSIGRMDRQMITSSLTGAGKNSLFSEYGQTDEDRQLAIRPHSLRHLQNTELFRLGVADTIITKRFNRRKLAQTYEYDHRSLAEDLDAITLKPEVEERLGEKSATVARLIKAGKASGPVVRAFRSIQKKQGEDAAIDYLRAEADGFHSTPYGHCVNSFIADPCAQHLECFNGCRHLVATGLTENRLNLIQLEAQLQIAVQAIEERKQAIGCGAEPTSLVTQSAATSISHVNISGIGIDNQLNHAKVRLDGVRKLLVTPAGQQVFPDGVDLSKNKNRNEGTVMDDIL